MEPEQVGVSRSRSLRDRQKEMTRRELRDAALELFSKKGYAQTSVDEIATAAGVSRSTFFRYFRSKEAILAGDAGAATDQFLQILERRPRSEGRLEALEETMIEFAEAQQSDDRREEIMAAEEIIAADPALSASRAVLTAKWRREVSNVLARRGGYEAPVLEDALAAAVVGEMTSQMSVEWRSQGSGRPVADMIRSYFRALRDLITS